MRPTLYAHPFSSYCQKALTALDEKGVDFEFAMLAPEHPDALAEFTALWPTGKFPVLRDDARVVFEATGIIEHLEVHHPGGTSLIPEDRDQALEVRMLDRIFDNYVHAPLQRIVGDALRPDGARDPHGVAEARALLAKSYAWLDARMQARTWAAGGDFSLADCAAAPALFYADWVHSIDAGFGHLRGYRERLLARPSFSRAVDGARPYRHLFPLGAPERD